MLKIALPILGSLFIVASILGYLNEDFITTQSADTNPQHFAICFALIGVIFFIIWAVFINHKVVSVIVDPQKIIVHKDGMHSEHFWHEVKSIKKLVMVEPPIYVLRIKGIPEYLLFVSRPKSIRFFFHVKDLSEMGALIKKKKKEFNL